MLEVSYRSKDGQKQRFASDFKHRKKRKWNHGFISRIVYTFSAGMENKIKCITARLLYTSFTYRFFYF